MRTIPSLFLLLALSSAGCGPGGTTGTGGSTSTDPCIVDPASCMGTCAGQCEPEPLGFAALFMYLWSGPVGSTPPECPAETPRPSLGYLDTPPDSVSCSPCSCGPSQGSCFLPSSMTANSAACPASGPGVQHTPFDAPTVWDGTCTAQDAVPSADSLTVSPTEFGGGASECGTSGGESMDVQGGKLRSLTCTSLSLKPDGKCPSGETCTFPSVEGFSVCIANFIADVPCPPGWPVKHLNYDESELCNCSCGDPVGESCSTTVTVYQDSACTKPLGSASVSASKPAACLDVAAGSALGSKSATPPSYTAGTCAPTLTKNHPWTLCCLP